MEGSWVTRAGPSSTTRSGPSLTAAESDGPDARADDQFASLEPGVQERIVSKLDERGTTARVDERYLGDRLAEAAPVVASAWDGNAVMEGISIARPIEVALDEVPVTRASLVGR